MRKTLNVFPENSLAALVISLDKGKPNKNFNFKFITSEFTEHVFQGSRKNYLKLNSFKHVSQSFSFMYRKINSL